MKGFLYQQGYWPHRTLEISVERGVVVVQGGDCQRRVAALFSSSPPSFVRQVKTLKELTQ